MTKRVRACDRIGQRFGRLTVRGVVGKDKANHAIFECLCDCGKATNVLCYGLTTGSTQSCGCYHKERAAAGKRTHGKSSIPIYFVWKTMIQRCVNPKSRFYKTYGGRGIVVCPRWLFFENFYEDMGDRPSDKHSLDRIDNDGNYCPENCRWATRVQQANNKGTNKYITYKGKTQTVAQWAAETGIGKWTLYSRFQEGWDIERALTQPARKRTVKQ